MEDVPGLHALLLTLDFAARGFAIFAFVIPLGLLVVPPLCCFGDSLSFFRGSADRPFFVVLISIYLAQSLCPILPHRDVGFFSTINHACSLPPRLV